MAGPSRSLHQRARDAAQSILERTQLRPRVAMLLGTGHASIANQLRDRVAIHAEDMPEGMAFTAPFLLGTLEGVPMVVADAPLAAHDGCGADDLTFPVRVLRAMGAELLVLTAGAASLIQQLEPGGLAVLEDHINLSGLHPLRGPHDEQLGPRFPDMSEPYNKRWQIEAREVAMRVGVPCLPGVFAAVPGPSLPTRAEYRFLRRIGADLVGMSLVPEVLAAVHSGFEVLALVGITQQILPEERATTSIEAMLDAADLAGPRMASVLVGLMGTLSETGVEPE
jgi:purine-nucleoside phosphorylase